MGLYTDVDLHAFVDGQCSPERQAAIAAYLASAPSDAARVEAWRRQKKTIKDLFAAAAAEPVPLWLTVGQIAPTRPPTGSSPPRDAIPLRLAKTGAPPDRDRGRPPNWALAFVAFAAGLALATAADRAVSWDQVSSHWPAAGQDAFLKRALEAQTTFGLDPDRPVDVADAPSGRLRAWLDARVPFRARIPELQAVGWALLGGRVTPDENGPAAFLVYTNAVGGRLSLFASRRDAAPVEDRDGVVTGRTDDGVSYAWMSSSDTKWLGQNAALLRHAAETAATD